MLVSGSWNGVYALLYQVQIHPYFGNRSSVRAVLHMVGEWRSLHAAALELHYLSGPKDMENLPAYTAYVAVSVKVILIPFYKQYCYYENCIGLVRSQKTLE